MCHATRLNAKHGLGGTYFVATDSIEGRLALAQNKQVVMLPVLPAFHIDRSDPEAPGAYSQYENEMIELFLLMNSTCMVMPRSGFSSLPVTLSLRIHNGAISKCFSDVYSCGDETKDNSVELLSY